MTRLDAAAGRDHVLGADDPALTLIESGDFDCLYCFAASRPVQSLLDRYRSLRLVWRHFPQSELHPRERTYRERVLEDVVRGEGAGVAGTLTFLVDAGRLVGHWRQLAQVIPAALAERGL